MKTSQIFTVVIAVCITATATWQLARRQAHEHPNVQGESAGKRLKFYQSPMHPWITSEKPGKCTVCGMDLVAVYEGESGFGSAEGGISLGSNIIQVLNVRSDAVKRGPLVRTLHVAGVIEDDDTRHRFVSAYVDGRVDKLFVNYVGAEVASGQPMASIYSPMLLNAEREYLLLGKTGATSDPASIRMRDAARQRLIRLGLTEEQIVGLDSKPADAIHSELLAPLSGTVVQRFVYEGQYVREGDKLFEIADFDTMWFKFDAYEQDVPWLRAGQAVDVTTASKPGKVYAARIVFMDPNVNDMTRSLKVRVEIPNPAVEINGQKKRELYHRLYAEGRVKVEIPETLLVPRSAVLSPGGDPLVYVDHGAGFFEGRKIKLGRAGDLDWEVLDGLTDGEKVVLQGNLMIDAQAQLNAVVAGAIGSGSQESGTKSGTHSTSGGTTATGQRLDPAQVPAVENLLKHSAALAEALASDNLNNFKELSARTSDLSRTAAAELQKLKGWEEFAARLQTNTAGTAAADLQSARKAFHHFGESVIPLSRLIKRQGGWNDLRIIQCPMVKTSFPGAPKTGVWIQWSMPVRNPYFGAEMLDCGTEVVP